MDACAALVVGEALIDRLPSGAVVAGAPLNVARHLQQLGSPALLVSRVGSDPEADQVAQVMAAAGLSPQGLQRDPRRPTGLVDVRMAADGSHQFHIAEHAAWDAIDSAEALAALRQVAPRCVVFGSLAQRAPASRTAIRKLLAGAGDALRFLDLNLRDGVGRDLALESLQLAHWAKVNEDELAQLMAWTGQPDAAALCVRLGLRRLIVTCGASGFRSHGERVAEGGGVPADPYVDSIGAGDAFSACLLAAHLQGKDWAPALQLANRFAAALCGQRGAAPAEPDHFYPPWRAALRALPEAGS